MDDLANRGGIKIAFESKPITLAINQIVRLKKMPVGVKDSRKYAQILGSIRVVGLVEAPVVSANPKKVGEYFLLDGHLRIEALLDLGIHSVECVVSTDDETYTYNKRINRIAAVQEHRMIKRAIERGVSERHIAEALGLELGSVRRRSKMLNGICPEAIEFLKDTHCPLIVFDTLRHMAPIRQIEAAELMVGQNNFSGIFVKALLAATPEKFLVQRRRKSETANTVSSEQISRMERELASLQIQVKSVEETYGIDNLHLGRGLISAKPNADRSQLDEGKVVCRELVITGCDPSALLDLVEEPLNKVARAIEVGAEADGVPAIALWRDVGPCALLVDERSDPVGIIATVG